MKRLLNIVGARPQFMKAAALWRVAAGVEGVQLRLLHTGQHYDQEMSEVFFDQLHLPRPDYQLHVGSATHGVQTARMLEGVEGVLLQEHFDGVIVYGDTNSTLAGALATAKLQVPVFHVEAGLRSNNMAMPEEQNRILVDHLSSVCFAPTPTAMENLRREGFPHTSLQRVILSGDVMYDNCLYYASVAEEQSDILRRLGLEKGEYVLATVHRDFNTDHPERLAAILQALTTIARDTRVVMPLHPRTAKYLHSQLSTLNSQLTLLPPASFFDMIVLERHACVVLTDSGGVQKEAFFYGVPSVILRPETEWVEIVQQGAGVIADSDPQAIVDACRRLAGRPVHFLPLFGNGHAAESILNEITDLYAM